MNKNAQKVRHAQAGFTLVELLLVVAILGTLAAVVMVGFRGRGEKARIGAARASIDAIGTAIRLYEVDCGRYPGALTALESNDGAPNWDGPYVEKALVDPWGTPFQYSVQGNGYKISSAGPDKAFGSGDDLTN